MTEYYMIIKTYVYEEHSKTLRKELRKSVLKMHK